MIRVPCDKRNWGCVFIKEQRKLPSWVSGICCGLKTLFIHAVIMKWRQQDEMLSTADLNVNVFKIVFMCGCYRPGISHPHVDGFRRSLKSYPREWYIFLYIFKYALILVSKVVVLFIMQLMSLAHEYIET